MAGKKGMRDGLMRRQHQDDIRSKIRCSQLINRLQKHADGEIEMTSTQISAARILLDKGVSNAPQETILSGSLEITRKIYE